MLGFGLLIVLASSEVLADYNKLSEGLIITRQVGKPEAETVSFHEQAGSKRHLVLTVLSDRHDRNKSQRDFDLHGHNRCYSTTGTVALNDQEIFSSKHFSLNTKELKKVITMKTDNVLSVKLRGKPGCSVKVSLERTNL